jgi:hypothetical protein
MKHFFDFKNNGLTKIHQLLPIQSKNLLRNLFILNFFRALLKNKIPLPPNECRYMYGCAFQSRLKSGTCFIRYQVLNNNGKSLANPQFKCVQGRVIVTKNPW